MIIKGLLRRYARWNPVHPTLGAFWGMGLGVGCGVGWGPGFGPEVIGYVGAGCGVGFSVGFTLAGVGIGLPANALFRMTYSAFAISNSALASARSTALPIMKNMTEDSWNSISARVTCLTRETCNGLSNVKTNMNLTPSIQLDEMKRFVLDQAQSAVRQLEAFRNQHLSPGKGSLMANLK